MRTMWKFQTKHFVVKWQIEREAFDASYMDKNLVKECRAKIRSGEWKCFASKISITHKQSGTELAAEYLGNSIYANPADFRDHFGMTGMGYGSYFSDMVHAAITAARDEYPRMRERAQKQVASMPALRN